MKNIVVLYHANCPDGFTAAWSFWKKFGEKADYIPVSYGDPIPSLQNKEVYIVDFCYHKEQLLEISKVAKSILVLDHHKTAQEENGDLKFCKFDMYHSGAYLAWDYCFPKTSVPNLVLYIEDRDLWKWDMFGSQEILSVIDSHDKTFENWDKLSSKLSSIKSAQWYTLFNKGEGILLYKENIINGLLKNKHVLRIAGFDIPAVNSAFFQSDLANRLSVGHPFAAAYYMDGETYRVSLRAQSGGEDVSLIAKQYGGGGHKSASGFIIYDIKDLK